MDLKNIIMSASTFKILFYLRKNYLDKEGKACIMIRITLNGDIAQFSSKLSIEPKNWDTKNNK
ncbi:MAG: Arm DNA-binding domain-containing protein, partial [Bacteroidales bacterium]